jgi:hypothetical protein
VGKAVPEIWPEEVRSVLDYNADTGEFRWKVRVNLQRAGERADAKHSEGYRQLALFGRRFLAHRLAWFYVHGVWPGAEIDHINWDRADNRIANLRAATRSQNGINNPLRKNNTSGITGVGWCPKRLRWTAQIAINRTCIPLGRYINKADAVAARKRAEQVYHGAFTPSRETEA